MNEELIQEIERRMLPHLNNEQLKELKNVLEDTLHGLTVLPREETGQNAPDIIYRDLAGFPLNLIARQILAEIVCCDLLRRFPDT